MMKFTFSAACLLAASKAQTCEPILLADDHGFNFDLVEPISSSNLTGDDKFWSDWNVPSSYGVELDPEDGQGYQISANVKRKNTVKLTVPGITDPSVLVGMDMLVFRVIV